MATRLESDVHRRPRGGPTGGIDAGSAPRYLSLPNVITLGGSWMLPGPVLAARDRTQIGALARAAAGLRAA